MTNLLKLQSRNYQGDVTSDIYSVSDDVLLYSERITIPKTLQKRILKNFHMGHPGTNRMKSLMRSFVYWPSMDQDITNMVKTCKCCVLAAKAPPITYKPWPKSEQPWSRIHRDYAGPLEDFYYLIVVDNYSKWSEVLRCRKPTTATANNLLHELFARFGVVGCLVSDNATQFTSSEFKEFCETSQIKPITTPQYHPRSNGQTKRFVEALKRALKKAYCSPKEKSLQQFLLVYRITANPNIPEARSPAEAMFGRKLDQCSKNCNQNRPYKTEPLLYHSNNSTLVTKSTSNTSETTILFGNCER